MGTLQFKNNASTTLSGSINNSQTAITVTNGANFPVPAGSDYFYATMYEVSSGDEINIEIVKVTATSGNNWTIVRAQDGTSARSRDGVATCYVEQRMTAASAQLMLQKDNNLSDVASASTARTNLGLSSMATQSASAVAITGGTISGVSITGVDSTTTIADNTDPTKQLAFEISGVSTGTTRTLTIPNASGTIALTSDLSAGYQPLDSDLTAFAGLSANGLVARTGAGAVSVRSIDQPAAGITVTNGDGVSGNPTIGLANDLAAVEGLSTTGFVRRTGADTWSASAIVDGDLPSALTGKTYNGLTLTANATGFTVAGGTTSKTLTLNNSITLAGTDGTTITLPSVTGTVALDNQTMYLGTTAVAINRVSGSLTLSGVDISGSAGSATTATTATKATNLAGGNGTTLLGAIGYQSGTDTTTLLSPNTTASKLFLSQTGTGTNGAAPAWSAVSKSDVGLANVENTALSTWAGSANITTLGTVATGTWNATTIGISKGGTGQTTAVAAFDALAPTTTLGDVIYHNGTDNVRLAGNTTSTRKFMRQTGNGTVSAAPAWDILTDADVPSALTGKTYNGLTLTAAATGFTVAGGTTSKTLTVSNTLTLAGTDASTLNIGAGGTLGSAAYTASTAYAPAAGSASIVTVGTITSGTWTGSAVGISYGGTGATSKTAAYNALSPMTTLGDIEYSDGTNAVRLAGSTLSSKRFLTQTGTGTVSAAPGWNAIVDGDIPSALTGKTYNGLSLTANATGFSVAGGTTSKTLTISNNMTLAGADGSTLNIGSGGTLGSAAFTATSAYAPAAGSTSITTLGTVTAGTWNAGVIGVNYGGTGVTTSTGSGNLVLSGSPTFTGTVTAATVAPSGNLAFSGTGNRITGDFSNTTLASRVAIQTSTTNGNTGLFLLPNGTAQIATFRTYNTSDPTNGSFGQLQVNAVEVSLSSFASGTGSTLPMTFYTAGAERIRIDTAGNVGIGTSSPGQKLSVAGSVESTTGGFKFPDASTQATAGYTGYRNKLINGNFDIWQRGTSFANPSSAYTADRWFANGTASTVAQTTAVVGYGTYAAAITASSATNSLLLSQAIESFDVDELKGKTVTFSFAFSSTVSQPAGSLTISVQKNATANTQTGGTWSTLTTVSGATSYSPTTGVQTATLTVTVPSDGTANGLRVVIQTTNITNASSVYVYNAQIEAASSATPFEFKPYGAELTLCQRFFVSFGGENSYERFGTGFAINSGSGYVIVNFPVTMRTAPSFSATAPFAVSTSSGAVSEISTPSLDLASTKNANIYFTGSFSSLTAGNATHMYAKASTATRMQFSSEL
jgi:hypothetical protein